MTIFAATRHGSQPQTHSWLYLEPGERVWWLQCRSSRFGTGAGEANSAPQISWLNLRGHFEAEEIEGRRRRKGKEWNGRNGRKKTPPPLLRN